MQPIQLDERLSLAMDLFPACEEGGILAPITAACPAACWKRDAAGA